MHDALLTFHFLYIWYWATLTFGDSKSPVLIHSKYIQVIRVSTGWWYGNGQKTVNFVIGV
jgi:hypothetical protein